MSIQLYSNGTTILQELHEAVCNGTAPQCFPVGTIIPDIFVSNNVIFSAPHRIVAYRNADNLQQEVDVAKPKDGVRLGCILQRQHALPQLIQYTPVNRMFRRKTEERYAADAWDEEHPFSVCVEPDDGNNYLLSIVHRWLDRVGSDYYMERREKRFEHLKWDPEYWDSYRNGCSQELMRCVVCVPIKVAHRSGYYRDEKIAFFVPSINELHCAVDPEKLSAQECKQLDQCAWEYYRDTPIDPKVPCAKRVFTSIVDGRPKACWSRSPRIGDKEDVWVFDEDGSLRAVRPELACMMAPACVIAKRIKQS